jgi:hypothetical protein
MSRKAFIGDTLKYHKTSFQAPLKNHPAGEVHYYKPILNFSSPHKGFEGCLPCHILQYLGLLYFPGTICVWERHAHVRVRYL